MKNPQKILNDRYSVIPRTLILIFKDDKVLLQKGSQDKKLWAGLYNGFGGHIERGEDVLTSARRELLEESGLTCENIHLCGTVTIDVAPDQGILMFVISGNNPTGIITGSDEGIPEWISISKTIQLSCVEDVPMLIEKIKILKLGELFHGHYSYDESGKLRATFS